MKYNYLYKITNILNGMIYIGVHSTNNLDDNYMGSGTKLREAVKKHGGDNFKKDIIQSFDDAITLYEAERSVVNKQFVKRSDTYNIAVGGNGHSGLEQILCEWCGKLTNAGNLAKHHGKFCEKNPNRLEKPHPVPQKKVKCPYCEKVGATGAMHTTHFKYCPKNPNKTPRNVGKLITCPHCGTTGLSIGMKTWHFDNCKGNPSRLPENRRRPNDITCPHCGKAGGASVMKVWHFDYCKKNPNRKEVLPRKKQSKPKDVTCPHCGRTGSHIIMKRWHFNNCKLRDSNN